MKLHSLFVGILIPFFSFSQGINFEPISLKEAIDKAKKEHKLIFVDAFTTWCGPCKMLSARVFPNQELGDYFNKNFINLKIDMEKGEGPSVSNRFAVRAYPTMLLIDENGKEVNRKMGYTDVAPLLQWAKESIDPNNSPEKLDNLLNEGNLPNSKLAEYAINAYQKEDFKKAASLALKYYDGEKNWDGDEAKGLFSLLKDPTSKPYGYYINKINTENGLTIKGNVVEKKQFIEMKFINDFAGYMNDNKDKDAKVTCKNYYGKMSKQVYALYNVMDSKKTKRYDDFITSANKYLKKYGHKNSEMNNAYAWDVYEGEHFNEHQVKTALKWGLRSIKINSMYANNDTVAALYYRLGNQSKARKYAENAIAIAINDGEDTSETKNLLKKINEMK